MTYEEIVTQVRQLSVEERKKLVMAIVDSFTEEQPAKTHSILELRGLGKELWEGIDAQEYVNQLRDEWDNRP